MSVARHERDMGSQAAGQAAVGVLTSHVLYLDVAWLLLTASGCLLGHQSTAFGQGSQTLVECAAVAFGLACTYRPCNGTAQLSNT